MQSTLGMKISSSLGTWFSMDCDPHDNDYGNSFDIAINVNLYHDACMYVYTRVLLLLQDDTSIWIHCKKG